MSDAAYLVPVLGTEAVGVAALQIDFNFLMQVRLEAVHEKAVDLCLVHLEHRVSPARFDALPIAPDALALGLGPPSVRQNLRPTK